MSGLAITGMKYVSFIPAVGANGPRCWVKLKDVIILELWFER